MANEYAVATDFTITIPGYDSDLLAICIEASSRAIDSYCSRRFFSTTTSKTYDGSNNHIVIDDLQSATSVVIDDTTLTAYVDTDSTDYYRLYDLNESTKTSIYISTTGTNLVITGTWGYGSVPLPIKQSCMLMTRRLYASATSGDIVSESTQTYRYSVAALSKDGLSFTEKLLLTPYQRLFYR